jgi:hypothetical protein
MKAPMTATIMDGATDSATDGATDGTCASLRIASRSQKFALLQW